MTKRNGVSVIIPAWNNTATIKKAIDSCLSQTLQPLEILVCDDGSTDGSRAVVKSIKSPLVKWISGSKHSGRPAVPRNRGLKIARGEWLAFLDADDMWLPDKLKDQITAAKKTGCLAICSNAYRQKSIGGPKTLYFNLSEKRLHLCNLLLTNFVICSSMLLHHSLLKKVGGFSEDLKLIAQEDYALWLRVVSLTNIYFLNKPLVIYYDHPETSVRSKANAESLFTKIYILKNFLCWTFKI